MFVRWKRKKLKKESEDRREPEKLVAELYKSYRENGKPKQKYVTTLGSFKRSTQTYAKSTGYVLNKLFYRYVPEFWTSAWKKLYELGIEGEELERIKKQIQKELPFVTDHSQWYPPTYPDFLSWSCRKHDLTAKERYWLKV